MNTGSRVHRVRLRLTPQKAVLAAVAEAHEYDSFRAWEDAVRRLPHSEQPLTSLVEAVRSGLRSDIPRQANVETAPAARRRSRAVAAEEQELEDERTAIAAAAVMEVVFLFDLHRVANELVADQLRCWDGTLRDLVHEGRALVLDGIAARRFLTSLSPSLSELKDGPAVPFDPKAAMEQVEAALTRGPRWLRRAGDVLGVLRDMHSAVGRLDTGHFHGIGLLFEAERSGLDRWIEVVELVRDVVVRSEMLTPSGYVESDATPSPSTAPEIVQGLVTAARMASHLVVGETATARVLALEFLEVVGSYA